MRFDVDLHRITIKLANRLANGKSLEMSVVDAGPRDAPQTMVFLHGFGGRAAYWEYQLEHFQADYRVVALDLRGHGLTDAPDETDGARYEVPELVADVEVALDLLQVPQRFILVAHSFGGALSSYFLKKHPQRVSAFIVIASAVQFRLRLAGRLLLRVPPVLLNGLRRLLPYLGYNVAKLYPPSHVVYLQNKNALAIWDGTPYLKDIKAPTLVILGERDILFSDVSYKDVARLIPNAEQVVIPVSAHQVMVERPDAVNRAIERFLQSQVDPVALAEYKTIQRSERRARRKSLEAERPWLKFYDARTPYQIKMPSLPLPRLLEACARRFAKTPAIDYFGRTVSWHEVDRLANRFAHGLQAYGIGCGDKVMLALPNMPQWIIAYFGILKIGAVAVLTDASAHADVLLSRSEDTDALMLITLAGRSGELCPLLENDPRAKRIRHALFVSPTDYMGWREKWKTFAPRVFSTEQMAKRGKSEKAMRQNRRFLSFGQLLSHGRMQITEISQNTEDIAVIAYTFGTGGTPVPVPLSHRNLAANALQLRHWLPESRPGDERFLAQQPLSSAYGLTGLLHLGVYLGATLILLPDDDVAQLLKTVKRTRPTYFPTTPTMVRQLTHTQGVRRYGLASIRVCAVSGSSLPREIREEFEKITRGRLIDAFGLTEAAPAVLAMPVAMRRQAGAVGIPLPDTEVKIIHLNSQLPCAPDTIGELWVKGPQVFSGYGGRSDRNKEFMASRLKDAWFATGDIASLNDDGFVTVIDRKDNMVVRHGEYVFPRQIEEILFEHPAVAHAQVKSTINETGVAQLHAKVLLHRKMHITVDDLLAYCAKRLRPSALPDSITVDEKNARPSL